MMSRSKIWFLGVLAIGLLMGGCATVKNKEMGGYDTPSRLWWNDLDFQRDTDGIPSDWEILDLSSESYDNRGERWTDVQSDMFDVMK